MRDKMKEQGMMRSKVCVLCIGEGLWTPKDILLQMRRNGTYGEGVHYTIRERRQR